MKFLDLFAGIGGFRLGLEMAGHECVGYVEIDKFARKSYEAIHNIEGEWTAHDITRVTNDDLRRLRDRGRVDVICGGFPCQAFSVAGKRGGFDDTRGTLFFEIARFADFLRPRYLFLENVVGLLNHDNGRTFETIIRALDEIGYDAEWDCLNSKDFGVPQNRDRLFIIGHLRGGSTRKVFPVEGTNGMPIKIAGKLDGKFRSTNEVLDPTGVSTCLNTMSGGDREPKVVVAGNTNPSGNGMNGQVFDSEGLSPTLTTNKGEGNKILVRPVLTPDREEKRQNGRRFKENGDPMFTLTSQDRHGVAIGTVIQKTHSATTTVKHDETGTLQAARLDKVSHVVPDEYRIRKLTPRECWRLQGFPDWAFDKAAEVNSDSQLYKQAGNSVTVNVIHAMAQKLGVIP